MIYLALIADAALLLVILRMVWLGADASCPREFFFLLSLLCYALLSTFAPSFPAWGHATLPLFSEHFANLPLSDPRVKELPR